jgi:4,5-dihydroxyphthalate decarboxylase
MDRRGFLKATSVGALLASALAPGVVAAQKQLSTGIGKRFGGGSAGATGGTLAVSIALGSNPRTWPVIDGLVKADGIDLIPSVLHPSEMFYRQLKFAEFDISDMSMSSFMMTMVNGDDRFIGLPVFTTHHFFHTFPLVRRDAGIESPEDLKGKRVGVPEYQQTSALWARGALQHEWGVRAQDIEWYMERNVAESHGSSTGFRPPKDVTIHQIPYEKNIGTMMLSGELDATLLYIVDPNLVDRSKANLWDHPDISPLFPDPVAEGIRYYRKTGIFPINHGMVVRRELADQHPWVLLNVLKAFNEANELANRQRMIHVEPWLEAGLLPQSAKEALQTPLIEHGIEANRHILEAAAKFSFEQGLTRRHVKIDELFAANTMDS